MPVSRRLRSLVPLLLASAAATAQTEIFLDQSNPLDGVLGGQGIGCFSQNNGAPDPECDQFDFQDAQTFTVGVGGQLVEIRVPVRIFNAQASAPVRLELVRLLPSGRPNEALSLGAAEVPASRFAGVNTADPETWPAFDLSGFDIEVVAGDRLAFIISTRSTIAYVYNPESGGVDFAYASGAGFRRNRAATTTWSPTSDFGFQTHVLSYRYADQENPLDGTIGGQGIGCFNALSGDADPECDQFDLQTAQSFTAGVEGRLASIRVPIIDVSGRGGEPATLDLLPLGRTNAPDSLGVLGSVDVPALQLSSVAVADAETWPRFELVELAVPLRVGERLAFAARTRETNAYILNPEFTPPLYTGGEGFRRNAAEDVAWFAVSSDYGFRTEALPAAGSPDFTGRFAPVRFVRTTQAFGCGASSVTTAEDRVVLQTASNCAAIRAAFQHEGAPRDGVVSFRYRVSQSRAHEYVATAGVVGSPEALVQSQPAEGTLAIPVQRGEQIVFDVRKSSGFGTTTLEISDFGFAESTLLAYWRFDGDLLDSSGNGHDGGPGGTIGFAEGRVGQALDVRGADGWVDIASVVLDDQPRCSMAVWVNANSSAPADPSDTCCNAVFAEDSFIPRALHFNQVVGAALPVYEWAVGAAGPRFNPVAPAPGEWAHYVWTFDQPSNVQSLYVDGVLSASATIDGPACGSGMPSTIGAWDETGGGATGRHFDGLIDDLRLYSRVLSARDAAALYQQSPRSAERSFCAGFEDGETGICR